MAKQSASLGGDYSDFLIQRGRIHLKNRLNHALLCFSAATVIAMTGCSSLKAPAAPTTPFLAYGDELHPWYEHAPWDAVWSSQPGHIMARSDVPRKIFVAVVDTTYLNKTKNKRGQWVGDGDLDQKDVQEITHLLRTSFMESIKANPSTNLELQDRPGPGTMVLRLSLIELSPTRVGVNGVADVGGLIIPGSKLVEEAAGLGVQAAGGEIAAGTIAIEMKITDGLSGAVLAEMKDRENDPASVLPNYRDFEEYGWSRKTIANWSQQFVQVFSTVASEQVGVASNVSILPW